MRVVFLEDVAGVALGGEIKEVKNGFARNYLIPKQLALPATPDSLQRVGRLKRLAGATRLKTLADMRALGDMLNGAQVNIAMRAGASGHLYGSVTNAIVVGELSKTAEREIDRRAVDIPEPIREVGAYEVLVRLHPDVDANITLLVHPADTDPAEFLSGLQSKEDEESASPEGESVAEVAPEDRPAGDVAAEDQPTGDVAETTESEQVT